MSCTCLPLGTISEHSIRVAKDKFVAQLTFPFVSHLFSNFLHILRPFHFFSVKLVAYCLINYRFWDFVFGEGLFIFWVFNECSYTFCGIIDIFYLYPQKLNVNLTKVSEHILYVSKAS